MDLKIMFGCQGYGSGHITNVGLMGAALTREGAEVDYLVSGRTRAQLDAFPFLAGCEIRKGLGFEEDDNGAVLYLKSVFNRQSARAMLDASRLDLAGYDLVLTNYESITAWAALAHGKNSITINHQAAFLYDIPTAFNRAAAGRSWGVGLNALVPVRTAVGLHWDSFGQPLLPPIVDPPMAAAESDPRKIVAYFNFENPQRVAAMLEPFTDYRFHLYSRRVETESEKGNVIFKKPSPAFRDDLRDCAGLIGNAGFETPSELLIMGKKMLVKPQTGQLEQVANARALQQLGYGDMMMELDSQAVARWLDRDSCVQIKFPDVAARAARWIAEGADKTMIPQISDALWHATRKIQIAVPR